MGRSEKSVSYLKGAKTECFVSVPEPEPRPLCAPAAPTPRVSESNKQSQSKSSSRRFPLKQGMGEAVSRHQAQRAAVALADPELTQCGQV